MYTDGDCLYDWAFFRKKNPVAMATNYKLQITIMYLNMHAWNINLPTCLSM